MRIDKVADQLNLKVALLETLERSSEKDAKTLRLAQKHLAACLEAQKAIQATAAAVQQTVHSRIATIVTRCLQTIYDENYVFKIDFEQKRGKTEARLVLVKGNKEVDPVSASGGGVVDVISLGLRIACLVLTKPASQRVLILDEPFRFVPAERIERVRLMIEELASELEIQFVIVTHEPLLQAGLVYQVG